MTPWTLLDSTRVPGDGGELCLYQRGAEYSIKIAGRGELMSSRGVALFTSRAQLSSASASSEPWERLFINSPRPAILIEYSAPRW